MSDSVEILNAVRIKKEAQQFNGRDYYYIEMGEYPQTYGGTDDSQLTENVNETITLNMSGTYSTTSGYSYVESVTYNIWTHNLTGERYIQHPVSRQSSSAKYADGTAVNASGTMAFFKLEPIKWDVFGYYTDDTKTTFVKVTDTANFDSTHTENLVVQSRNALQGTKWNSTNSDVDYINSLIKTWLADFYSTVLEAGFDDHIEAVENQYTDTSANTSITGTTIAGSVTEKVWLLDYSQANGAIIASDAERRCSPSDFALGTYAYQFTNTNHTTITKSSGGTSWYWLRSSCNRSSGSCVGIVNSNGLIGTNSVTDETCVVRPALLINL